MIYYLEQVEENTVVRAVLCGQRDDQHVQVAIEAVRSSAAMEASFSEARAHIRSSQEAPSLLPTSTARETLSALCDYVVDRRY